MVEQVRFLIFLAKSILLHKITMTEIINSQWKNRKNHLSGCVNEFQPSPNLVKILKSNLAACGETPSFRSALNLLVIVILDPLVKKQGKAVFRLFCRKNYKLG